MSKKQEEPTKKMNAAQKIEVLEQMLINHDSKFHILADEIDGLNNKLISLAKRLNATIRAADEGGISSDAIKSIEMSEKVKELRDRVDYLIQNGILKEDKELPIGDDVFFVGRELDENGGVLNPRIQWAAKTMDQDLKDLLYGHKTGDVVKNEESNSSLEVLEVYVIVPPKVQQDFTKEEAAKTPEVKVSKPKISQPKKKKSTKKAAKTAVAAE